VNLGLFFSFLILYTVGRTPWTRDHPVAKPLPTHRTTQTQSKRTQTSMPRVGLEPTIPVFEREKTVHVLDRAARGITYHPPIYQYFLETQISIYTPLPHLPYFPSCATPRPELNNQTSRLYRLGDSWKTCKYISGLELDGKFKEMQWDLTLAQSLSHPI
jgi:hypothetical protein